MDGAAVLSLSATAAAGAAETRTVCRRAKGSSVKFAWPTLLVASFSLEAMDKSVRY